MPAAVGFDTLLRSVVGGPTTKALAAAFGHHTVGDLLRHHPRRYIDMERPESLEDIRVGQHVTMLLTVRDVQVFRNKSNPKTFRTKVTFTDGRTGLDAVFFNQKWIEHSIVVGSAQFVTGVVGEYQGRPQLTHPQLQTVPEGATLADVRSGRRIIPVYPASQKITSWRIEETIDLVLKVVTDFPEPLPESVRSERSLPDARRAFFGLHRPEQPADWAAARRRFVFEEAFVLQSAFAMRRADYERSRAEARTGGQNTLAERFVERLPFTLTAGQHEVTREISADLARTVPMHRLLQGEVGSGKTLVALLAMLRVVDSGAQAAILAPTEVLAAQHHHTITTMLGDLAAGGMLGGAEGATRVALLTGSMSTAARREALLDIVSGAAGIVIGTHALLHDAVEFAELGLLVIDEQHRFGVEQRSVLIDRADVTPHVLVMTATPIPRTIAMTVFGDLDISVLRELPGGRQPIQTTVVPAREKPGWLGRAWERIREEAAQGRQAYVVASRIGEESAEDSGEWVDDPGGDTSDDSGDDGVKPMALLDVFERLETGPLVGLRLGLLHGRLDAAEKDRVMAAFAAGEIDVLVATTVIEVGVDVPNATVMVIMDADRFGISQLHQLRGRVGRGHQPGLCLLVTFTDPDAPARERLDIVAATSDGFELARHDVELRREGDVLGARQSGVRSSLRFLRVVRDEDVIAEARDVAWRAIETGDVPDDLRAAVKVLEETEQADYLERT